MAQLEAAGIVGPQDPRSKNREVLIKTFAELDEILKKYLKSLVSGEKISDSV